MADDPLQQDANDRIKECRKQKAYWLADFREAYFMAAPQRQREMSSLADTTRTPRHDESELQTSLPFELCGDFVTEVVNTFMPEAQQWCERGRGMFIPAAVWDQVVDKVREGDAQIFEAIKASNFYAEIAKAYYPDLAIGTAAVWIDRRRPHEPIRTMAIPLRELEVKLGPDGDIDDRWVIRHTTNNYVRALLPKGIVLPAEIGDPIDKNPSHRTEVRWGFWRLWDREDDECWQHVIMVKDTLVHDVVLAGEGSCPLVPCRFNGSADWPFGHGPLLQGMPDLRQVDQLEGDKVEAVDRAINPPITYPNDSFAAVESGMESGAAYPIIPGSEGAVKKIYDQPTIEPAILEHEAKEHRLRRLFFIDYPQQTGDTPPTLGQWLDELARAQRRIGTPGMGFWLEGPAKYYLRFKYLLEVAGVIAPIKVDGKTVSARPMNPAQRAAEQQEIAMAVQAIQILTQAFPEEFKALIDGKKTMEAFLEKMRVKLLIFRDEKTVNAAVDMIAKLTAGHLQKGGGDPAQAAGLQ